MLHPARHFGHKGWATSVANREVGRTPGNDPLDGVQPLRAVPVSSQVPAGVNENNAEVAVGGPEHFLALTERRRCGCNAFRQPCQAEGIITRSTDFLW